MRPSREAFGIFSLVLLVLLVVQAPRLSLTNDEGIVLEAAQRMAQGQKLYVDFFGYMSPGSYWLQEAAFRLFGVTKTASQLPVLFDFALCTALLYWWTLWLSRGSRPAAGIAAFAFFAFQTASPGMLTAQHRWDSAALSLLGLALAASAGTSRARWAGAGALLAFAAFCTPSLGLLAVVTFAWMLWAHRGSVVWLVAGGGGVAALAVAAMAQQGILQGFLQQMAWLKSNYSEVNVMPYGAMIGGYGSLFEGADPVTWPLVAIFAGCIALAAVVPVTALGGGALALRFAKALPGDRASMVWLMACAAAYLATAYPRPDLMHLAFVAALPAAMTAAWVSNYLPKFAQIGLSMSLGLLATIFLFQGYTSYAKAADVQTPVGVVRALPGDREALAAMLQRVKPGDSLYVHPYMPMLYFLTQTRNPSRFSYLAPGMMTSREEQLALADLRANPPRWVLFFDLPRKEFLRVFPNAGSLNHKFETIEAWLREEYSDAPGGVPAAGGYRLLELRDPANKVTPAHTRLSPPPAGRHSSASGEPSFENHPAIAGIPLRPASSQKRSESPAIPHRDAQR